MWDLILSLGSLAGLIAIPGAIYLYTESRKLQRLEAEKEYRIARVELGAIERNRDERVAALEKRKEAVARTSNNNTWVVNRTLFENLDAEQQAVRYESNPEELKLRAKLRYYRDLKNHKFLWFLRKNTDDDDTHQWLLEG